MQPRPKLRLWQLSLRTLMLSTALICVASGVYARWMRPRKLELLVEEFNKRIDERHYDDAYEIALEANRGYPKNAVTDLMVAKAEFAKVISTNTQPAGCGTGSWRGGGCYCGVEGISSDSQVSYGDPEKWKTVTGKRKRR